MSIAVAAQQKTAGKKEVKQVEKSAPAGKKVLLPYVYLGNSTYKSGAIQKKVFDDLLKQGLTAHDSLGNKYKVTGFEFSYGERSLYEDSLGTPMIVTDYLTEYCTGNTVTPGIAASLPDRTKAGDSVYFDGIRVLKYLNNSTETVPANETTLGMGMKFGIIK